MNCDECKSRLRKDNETGGHWCPVCSFNNARARQLAAERERDEARAELERVKAERDEARKVCEYWLHHARFLTGDYHKDSEYNLAVESLKSYKLNEGIEP